MKYKILATSSLLLLLSGCPSTDTVRKNGEYYISCNTGNIVTIHHHFGDNFTIHRTGFKPLNTKCVNLNLITGNK